MAPHPVIALFGPTAVGKTAVAVAVAKLLEQRGEEVVAVSLDSIAVYRELRITSGAPTPEQLAELPHHLVGIRSVRESFSAGECAELAQPLIDAAIATGKRVIAVGGTGLYMRAVLSDVGLRKPVSARVREGLQLELQELGPQELHSRLAELDPEAARRIEATDGRRITRALELIESGEPAPAPSNQLWTAAPRVPTIAVGLQRDDAELRSLIEARAHRMLADGGHEEVVAAQALGASATAAAAVGWHELLDRDVDRLITRTWQLARRQRTWMRKMADVERVDISGLDPTVAAAVVLGVIDRSTPAVASA